MQKNARLAYIPQDANVPSEGTRPVGEGACRKYNKKKAYVIF